MSVPVRLLSCSFKSTATLMFVYAVTATCASATAII